MIKKATLGAYEIIKTDGTIYLLAISKFFVDMVLRSLLAIQ